MARGHDTATYKKLLLHFMGESDPLYSMLQWLTERMMEVESELKVGAVKGKHTSDRTTHFSGTRVRRFDTRLGTLYLLVPKLRLCTPTQDNTSVPREIWFPNTGELP